MKTVKLGKTGLKVSRIGMGGIPIQRPTEDEAIKVIRRCLDLGITFIDTARGYGTSEERFGKAIVDCRDQVIITTKTGRREKASALKELEQSLQNLQTDYIDLWQLHNVSTLKEYEMIFQPGFVMDAVQEALAVGKIKHIGISSHSLDVALKAVSSGHFETIQFPFNFISNEPASELIPLAKEYNVGFIAMKPFAGGMIRKANLAIKYQLQFDNVVPDPGIEKVEEIEEIVDIVNGSWKINSQEKQEMEDIRTQLGRQFCRQCGYCQPCPQEVQIPMIMITKIMFKLWPKETISSWMGKVIESGRNCVQCGECEEKCPYQLPIREMIIENIKFYEEIFRGRK